MTPERGARVRAVGRDISRVYRFRQRFFEQRLGDQGIGGGQVGLLYLLYDGDGVTQTELAERLAIDRASATELLRRMEQAGLISRRADPDDRRAKRVVLTAKAKALRPRMEALRAEWANALFGDLTEAEQRQVTELLGRLAEHASEAVDGRREAERTG